MYSDLNTFLSEHGYRIEIQVRDLHHSSCASSLLVHDLSQIKTVICNLTGQAHPPSVSGLFFGNGGKLFFVQTVNYLMVAGQKSFAEFTQSLTTGTFLEKIQGTVMVLDYIISNHGFGENFNEVFHRQRRLRVKTLVILDLTSREYVNMALANLDTLHPATATPYLGEIVLVPSDSI